MATTYTPYSMPGNPFLGQQADAITSKVNQNLSQQQLPMVRSGAMLAGGYGGSRQGIAEGLAMRGANDSISQALANLYGSAWESEQGRNQQMAIAQMNDATQRQGLANQLQLGQGQLDLGNMQARNSYDLGLRGAGTAQFGADTQRMLGMGGLRQNAINSARDFYGQQRGQDLQQYGLAAQLFGQGMQGLGQQGAGVYGAGQNQYSAGYAPYQGYANLLSPFIGLNSQQVTTVPGASPWAGALGGAVGGMQLGRIFTGGGN